MGAGKWLGWGCPGRTRGSPSPNSTQKSQEEKEPW